MSAATTEPLSKIHLSLPGGDEPTHPGDLELEDEQATEHQLADTDVSDYSSTVLDKLGQQQGGQVVLPVCQVVARVPTTDNPATQTIRVGGIAGFEIDYALPGGEKVNSAIRHVLNERIGARDEGEVTVNWRESLESGQRILLPLLHAYSAPEVAKEKGSHYVLLVIDPSAKQVLIINPLGIKTTDEQSVEQFIKNREDCYAADFLKQFLTEEEQQQYRIFDARDVTEPQQTSETDGKDRGLWSCGVHTLLNARQILTASASQTLADISKGLARKPFFSTTRDRDGLVVERAKIVLHNRVASLDRKLRDGAELAATLHEESPSPDLVKDAFLLLQDVEKLYYQIEAARATANTVVEKVDLDKASAETKQAVQEASTKIEEADKALAFAKTWYKGVREALMAQEEKHPGFIYAHKYRQLQEMKRGIKDAEVSLRDGLCERDKPRRWDRYKDLHSSYELRVETFRKGVEKLTKELEAVRETQPAAALEIEKLESEWQSVSDEQDAVLRKAKDAKAAHDDHDDEKATRILLGTEPEAVSKEPSKEPLEEKPSEVPPPPETPTEPETTPEAEPTPAPSPTAPAPTTVHGGDQAADEHLEEKTRQQLRQEHVVLAIKNLGELLPSEPAAATGGETAASTRLPAVVYCVSSSVESGWEKIELKDKTEWEDKQNDIDFENVMIIEMHLPIDLVGQPNQSSTEPPPPPLQVMHYLQDVQGESEEEKHRAGDYEFDLRGVDDKAQKVVALCSVVTQMKRDGYSTVDVSAVDASDAAFQVSGFWFGGDSLSSQVCLMLIAEQAGMGVTGWDAEKSKLSEKARKGFVTQLNERLGTSGIQKLQEPPRSPTESEVKPEATPTPSGG